MTNSAERHRILNEIAAAKRRREWISEEVEKGAISPALAVYAIESRKELDALFDRLNDLDAKLSVQPVMA